MKTQAHGPPVCVSPTRGPLAEGSHQASRCPQGREPVSAAVCPRGPTTGGHHGTREPQRPASVHERNGVPLCVRLLCVPSQCVSQVGAHVCARRGHAGLPSFLQTDLTRCTRLCRPRARSVVAPSSSDGPGRALLRGCLGASADLPRHCHLQTSLSRSVMTFLPLTETKTRLAQPGTRRGGRRDPGGPSNWFICQIIRGSEGAVIGHSLLGSRPGCRGMRGDGGGCHSGGALTVSRAGKAV